MRCQMLSVVVILAVAALGGGLASDICQGPLVQIVVQGTGSRPVTYFGVSAPFGGQLQLNETLSGTLVVASPQDACSPLEPFKSGSLVLVQRGTCNFTDKAANVQQAGGSAMLMYDNVPGCISMGAPGNSTSVAALTLPSISISQASGGALAALVLEAADSPVQVTLQAVEVSEVDGSALVLWIMAVGTLVAGSMWAGHDYVMERRLAAGEPNKLQNHVSQGRPEEVVDITAQAAVAFVFLASAMLLIIFFFFNQALFYVLLVFLCLASIQATTATLATLFELVSPRLAKRSILLPYLGQCPIGVLAVFPLASATAITWAVMRHEDWAWVLQDVLGICLMLLIFRTLRLNSLKVACILLPLTFAYDIFWVFIQPMIFGGGKSVMVEVAEGGGLNESLPMLLRVPYLGLPKELGGYSMLGFGDIILPGLLVAYLRRVDLDLHRTPSASSFTSGPPCGGNHRGHGTLASAASWCGYWLPCCVAYGLGLVLTYLALVLSWFGDQGQPALLYLVPCTLGTTLLLGYMRGDLAAMWEGSTSSQRKLWGHAEPLAVGGGEPGGDVEGGEGQGVEEQARLLPR